MKFLPLLLLCCAAAGGQNQDTGIKDQIKASRGAWASVFETVPDTFGIDWLPPGLPYEKGKVSLIPAPADRYERWMAIYLVNDTEMPLEGAIGPGCHLSQEVLIGNRWERSALRSLECGTGEFPPTKDLPPGHATLFLGTSSAIGDLEGTLRYHVTIGSSTVIASAPLKGRLSSKSLAEAPDDSDFPSSRLRDNIPRDGTGFSEWSAGKIATSPEELVAALNLERHYDASRSIRVAMERWRTEVAQAGDEQCAAALAELQRLPWEADGNEAAVFRRCREALLAGADHPRPYGSPEGSPAVVWRYLSCLDSFRGSELCNPERALQLKAIRSSGNPWGVSREEAAALAELAAERIARAPDEESEAAAYFLRTTAIRNCHFPDAKVRALLEIDRPHARLTAVSMLVGRGMKEEAGKWLAGRREKLRNEIPVLWPAISSGYREDFATWETNLALDWLEDDFHACIAYLAFRVPPLESDKARGTLPEALKEPILRFLEDEAENHRIGAEKGPQPPGEGLSQRAAPLLLAMRTLASWRDPADRGLLREFLKHPAAAYYQRDGKPIRYYPVREATGELLRELGETPPADLIIEEMAR